MKVLVLLCMIACILCMPVKAYPISIESASYVNFSQLRISGEDANLGEIELNVPGHGRMTSFCSEFFVPLKLEGDYGYEAVEIRRLPFSENGLNAAQTAALRRAFDELGSDVELIGLTCPDNQDRIAASGLRPLDRHESAALQMLIWEIVHDYDGVNDDSIDPSQGRIALQGPAPERVIRIFRNLKRSALKDQAPAEALLVAGGLLLLAPLGLRRLR